MTEFEQVLRAISRDTQSVLMVPDALDYLAEAKLAHPEHLCIKDVYGAMEVIVGDNRVVCLGRNGIAEGSPRHVHEYMLPQLLAMATRIGNNDDVRDRYLKILNSWSQGEQETEPIDCLELHQRTGIHECLKGFNWNHHQRATRPSAEFCPNSRAGCTERLLLQWLPAVVGWLQMVGANGLEAVVSQVDFSYDRHNPNLLMRINGGDEIVTSAPLAHQADIQKSVDRLGLVTQITPCQTCTKEIIGWNSLLPGKLNVVIQHLSQYRKNEVDKVQHIDCSDMGSIQRLAGHGIKIQCMDALDGDPIVRIRK